MQAVRCSLPPAVSVMALVSLALKKLFSEFSRVLLDYASDECAPNSLAHRKCLVRPFQLMGRMIRKR